MTLIPECEDDCPGDDICQRRAPELIRTGHRPVLVVVLSAGVAYGHGQVVSFHALVSSGGTIATVPIDGFVLTDIAHSPGSAMDLSFYQDSLTEENRKLDVTATTSDTNISFPSGITFDGSSTILLVHGFGGEIRITLSGYIPCPDPCGGSKPLVPAVGNVGLGVLFLGLAGGAFVPNRRQRQAA